MLKRLRKKQNLHHLHRKHKKHFSKKWGIVIIGILLLGLAVVIPQFNQIQNLFARAAVYQDSGAGGGRLGRVELYLGQVVGKTSEGSGDYVGDIRRMGIYISGKYDGKYDLERYEIDKISLRIKYDPNYLKAIDDDYLFGGSLVTHVAGEMIINKRIDKKKGIITADVKPTADKNYFVGYRNKAMIGTLKLKLIKQTKQTSNTRISLGGSKAFKLSFKYNDITVPINYSYYSFPIYLK